MNILETIQKRYSVRDYQDNPVEREKLLRVLEAARLAPSAKNLQEWRFVVVTEKGLREAMVEACNQQIFVGTAPVILACCSAYSAYKMRCGQMASPIDVAIAMAHLSLQATAEGLGTCWIGSFFPDKVRKLLNIPEEIEIVQMMTLGYPVLKAMIHKNRHPLEKIFSENQWKASLQF